MRSGFFVNHQQDEHPDGPDPIRDMVWGEALTGLAFDRPLPRFGEVATDDKLDNVVARNDRSKPVTDVGESIPASASSRKPPPIHPMAGMVTWITPSLGTPPASQPRDLES
jgi:hypothetical protein